MPRENERSIVLSKGGLRGAGRGLGRGQSYKRKTYEYDSTTKERGFAFMAGEGVRLKSA